MIKTKSIIILIASVSVIIGGTFFYIYSTQAPTETLPPIENIIVENKNNKIVADIAKKQIILYQNDEPKEFFDITENSKLLFYLPSGEYSTETIASLNLEDAVTDFANTNSAKFFILNSNRQNPSGLDEQNRYFLKDDGWATPKINAKAFLVADLENGSILFQKNKDTQYPIASITKLMTALVALDELDQDKYITITKEMLSKGYGSYGNLRRGEELTVSELMYPLLLSSSNDASFVLSMDYGQEDFMRMMNDRATSMKLTQTSYEEPSGLSPNNISTAEDLFSLSQYLYKNKKWILDITSLKTINNWRNNNYFAGKKNYMGGKNGYTDEAIETAISLFSLSLSNTKNSKIAIILLQSKDRETDALAILKWLKGNVVYRGETEPTKLFTKEDVDNFTKSMENISVAIAGNINVGKSAIETLPFSEETLSTLSEADVSFAGLDAPISDLGTSIGANSSRMHPVTAGAFKSAGFDTLSIATGYIGNWSKQAFEDTIFRLENEKILPAGGGLSLEKATEPAIVERKGVKIGFLGVSDTGPDWLKAKLGKSGILLVDDKFPARIKHASTKTDILIVAIDFGEQSDTKTISQLAIDSGAKIVVANTPSKTPKIENYNDGLIIYNPNPIAQVTLSGLGEIKGVE